MSDFPVGSFRTVHYGATKDRSEPGTKIGLVRQTGAKSNEEATDTIVRQDRPNTANAMSSTVSCSGHITI